MQHGGVSDGSLVEEGCQGGIKTSWRAATMTDWQRVSMMYLGCVADPTEKPSLCLFSSSSHCAALLSADGQAGGAVVEPSLDAHRPTKTASFGCCVDPAYDTGSRSCALHSAIGPGAGNGAAGGGVDGPWNAPPPATSRTKQDCRERPFWGFVDRPVTHSSTRRSAHYGADADDASDARELSRGPMPPCHTVSGRGHSRLVPISIGRRGKQHITRHTARHVQGATQPRRGRELPAELPCPVGPKSRAGPRTAPPTLPTGRSRCCRDLARLGPPDGVFVFPSPFGAPLSAPRRAVCKASLSSQACRRSWRPTQRMLPGSSSTASMALITRPPSTTGPRVASCCPSLTKPRCPRYGNLGSSRLLIPVLWASSVSPSPHLSSVSTSAVQGNATSFSCPLFYWKGFLLLSGESVDSL